MMGRDVAEEHKILNVDQVREVFKIILDTLINGKINIEKMTDRLLDEFPFLKRFEAKRIIKTETTRVIFYAREQEAKRQGLENYYYSWTGPLDHRTTPTCYYLQTGELRDGDIKELSKHGHVPADLPIIPPEGLLLEDLKDAVRDTARCFGWDQMLDAWTPHINCRHTFARGNRAAEPEESMDEAWSEFEDIINSDEGIPYDSGDVMTHPGIVVQPTENGPEIPQGVDDIQQKIIDGELYYYDLDDDEDSLIFNESVHGKPCMYDGGTRDYKLFEDDDEQSVYSMASVMNNLMEMGVDETRIVWSVIDQTGIDEDTAAYIFTNRESLMERLAPFVA